MPVPIPPHIDMAHAPASLRYVLGVLALIHAAVLFYGAWDILRRRR